MKLLFKLKFICLVLIGVFFSVFVKKNLKKKFEEPYEIFQIRRLPKITHLVTFTTLTSQIKIIIKIFIVSKSIYY